METNQNFKIEINLSESSFSISGSEDFIDNNIKELKEYIKDNYITNKKLSKVKNNENKTIEKDISKEKHELENGALINRGLEAGLFETSDDRMKVRILEKVPGKGVGARMINMIVIALYLKKDHILNKKEIINVCEEQQNYDKTHFSTIMKRNLKLFNLEGKGKNIQLKPTVNGTKLAKKLINEMLKNKNE
ncbi:MAG: hypothetical protein M3036_13850 [Bifidobacteriales bacterium]|nr:hypothetical protein [Bifidobacteriales bacterium]